MKLKIWTRAYQPFIMGGDVHAPIGTEVEVGKAVSVGKGFKCHVIISPKGHVHIAEATTGAFVGTSLEQVKADVKAGGLKVMRKQVAEAAELRERVRWQSEAEFWSMFRNER